MNSWPPLRAAKVKRWRRADRTTVTMLAYRKVACVKTCHSTMTLGGHRTTFQILGSVLNLHNPLTPIFVQILANKCFVMSSCSPLWRRLMSLTQPSIKVNSCDVQASVGLCNRCPCCDVSHKILSSAVCNYNDSYWHVQSLMLFFELHNLLLCWVPSIIPCSMIFGSVSWWQK